MTFNLSIHKSSFLLASVVAALLMSAVMSLTMGKASAAITVCHAWQQPSWGRARDCDTDSNTLRMALQYQDMLADGQCVRISVWEPVHGWVGVLGANSQVVDNILAPASCAGSTPGVLGPLRTFWPNSNGIDPYNYRLTSGSGSFTTICLGVPPKPDFPSGKPSCFEYF